MVGEKGTIALTGATGYIGIATVKAALLRGYRILALGRRAPNLPGVEFQHYDLREAEDLDAISGCIALIHLAADTQAGSRMDVDVEVKAAERIFAAASKHRVPVVFVSSQTASPEAATAYGQSKWLIERIVQKYSGCAVRPGLVYGGEERGLFGQLCSLARNLPVLPSFLPSPLVQPIHVEDLAIGLVNSAEQRPSKILKLAQDEPVTFTDFLRIIVHERLRTKKLFLPFPAFLLPLIEPIVSSLLPRAPDLDRIRSLYATPIMRTSDDLQRIGLTLRPLASGMHRTGNGTRRAQLVEAAALLAYVLRHRPPSRLMRRYVNAMNTLFAGEKPLSLPWLVRRFTWLIAIIDRASTTQVNSKFESHLSCAVLIAEASPAGARRFLPGNKVQRPLLALLMMARAAAIDTTVRIVCLLFTGPLTRVLKRAERGIP
jgi:nucleoside-diphosphate-sugar epimerase